MFIVITILFLDAKSSILHEIAQWLKSTSRHVSEGAVEAQKGRKVSFRLPFYFEDCNRSTLLVSGSSEHQDGFSYMIYTHCLVILNPSSAIPE
jgi:hypothetical protein